MTWTITKGIDTPRGLYVPVTDNLTEELKAAARFAGLRAFNVKIDGGYVNSAADLHTNSVAALIADVKIESVEVVPFDTAG